MAHVEGITGAGVVHVELVVIVNGAVVGVVVDALHGQRGSHVIALGGVVVDHVQDHFDVRLVQCAHHGLELLHLTTQVGSRAVLVVRGEERNGVVAPVVTQPLIQQRGVLHELVHRHQFDRRHTQLLQVLYDRGVRHARVRTALLLGNLRVLHGQALDVGFVDHGLVVRRVRGAVALPVEERVDHHALHHVLGGVLIVVGVLVAEVVGEHGLVPVHATLHGLDVGVEQQLAGVAAQTLGRVPRAVHAVAVALTGLDLREVGVPHVAVHGGDIHAGFLAVLVEQTQLNLFGHFREKGEISACAVERGA